LLKILKKNSPGLKYPGLNQGASTIYVLGSMVGESGRIEKKCFGLLMLSIPIEKSLTFTCSNCPKKNSPGLKYPGLNQGASTIYTLRSRVRLSGRI
jgi:hypothetical protein